MSKESDENNQEQLAERIARIDAKLARMHMQEAALLKMRERARILEARQTTDKKLR